MTSPAPLTLIVAVSANRGIGRDGQLPWRLPEDLARFKKITMGHAIIMGRKTHESIGRPLPGRRNIVISRQPGLTVEGCEVAPSLSAALEMARSTDPEPVIIGGGEIYEQALPMATKIELTEVHQVVPADAFFPEIPADEWIESGREARDGYSFVTLTRR